MDLDGDGVLSMYELEYFYEDQCQKLEAMAIEPLPFEDCLCQMLDLVKPEVEGRCCFPFIHIAPSQADPTVSPAIIDHGVRGTVTDDRTNWAAWGQLLVSSTLSTNSLQHLTLPLCDLEVPSGLCMFGIDGRCWNVIQVQPDGVLHE